MRNLTISGEIDAATGDFSGAIDVAGTANLDVVDIDGAVDMATTLALAGNADFNGDLDVDGTTNLDVVDIDGAVDMASTLQVDGLVTASANILLNGTTPTLTIGDAGAEDTKIVFDGNAQDFYIGLDDSEDDLLIGRGSTVGTSADIRLNADGDIGIGVAPDNVGSGKTLHILGHNTDGANIRLQSSGDTAGTDDMTITKNNTQGIINLIGGDTFIIKTSNTERLSVDGDGVASITTSGNGDNLTLISTDADANVGPNLLLYRNSGSPADGDVTGDIEFMGRNDNSQDVSYARITSRISDASDGTEDGRIDVNMMIAGTEQSIIKVFDTDIIFNDDSLDINFRVESTDCAKAFYIDGTKAHMHITGTASGTATKVSDYSTGIGSIQLGIGSNIHSYDYNAIDGPYIMSNGWMDNGTNKYVGTGAATRTGMYAGIWRMWNAESGSADGTISFVERFGIALNGDLTATDTSIASNSDQRLKENIADYNYDISKFKQFKAKTFDWKNPELHSGVSGNRGFIAQDILSVDDYYVGQKEMYTDRGSENGDADYELIPADGDGKHLTYTSKFGKKDAMYISVIQQLITRIEALEG